MPILHDPTPARNWSLAVALVGILALYLPLSLGGFYDFLRHQELALTLLIHFLFDLVFALGLVEVVRTVGRIDTWSDKKHFSIVFIVWVVLALVSAVTFVSMRM